LAVTGSLRALLAGAIDYAGMYPPSNLDFGRAVDNYRRYQGGPYAWMLGRLVVPLARASEAGDLPLAVVVGPDLAGHVTHEVVEAGAAIADEIRRIGALTPPDSTVYFEGGLLEAVSAVGARAKIRTGGVTREMFPPAEAIARFIRQCVARR